MTRLVITQNNPTPLFWHVVNFLDRTNLNPAGWWTFWPSENHADPGGELKRAIV